MRRPPTKHGAAERRAVLHSKAPSLRSGPARRLPPLSSGSWRRSPHREARRMQAARRSGPSVWKNALSGPAAPSPPRRRGELHRAPKSPQRGRPRSRRPAFRPVQPSRSSPRCRGSSHYPRLSCRGMATAAVRSQRSAVDGHGLCHWLQPSRAASQSRTRLGGPGLSYFASFARGAVGSTVAV